MLTKSFNQIIVWENTSAMIDAIEITMSQKLLEIEEITSGDFFFFQMGYYSVFVKHEEKLSKKY